MLLSVVTLRFSLWTIGRYDGLRTGVLVRPHVPARGVTAARKVQRGTVA
jgi:hypothetical protein